MVGRSNEKKKQNRDSETGGIAVLYVMYVKRERESFWKEKEEDVNTVFI